MHIKLNNISYLHADKEKLFDNLSLSISKSKAGFVGDNGTGKTTLLKIISGDNIQSEGSVIREGSIVIFPQDFSSFSQKSIAEVLQVKEKLESLEKILNGNSSEKDFEIIGEDWNLHEKIKEVFSEAKLYNIELSRKFDTLSGGEKSRLLFSSLMLNKPDFALLDEPTNHLDSASREILYSLIKNYNGGLLIVSHDRELLNLMDEIIELASKRIKIYGGNYDFYKEQKEIEAQAAVETLNFANIEYKKALKEKKKAIERQEIKMSKAKPKAIAEGVTNAARDYLQNKSMKTFSRLKNSHNQKTESHEERLKNAKEKIEQSNKIIIDVNSQEKIYHKKILEVENVNYELSDLELLWKHNVSFALNRGERLNIVGVNGSGKTLLLKMITGEVHSSTGSINVLTKDIAFLDQNMDILDNDLNIFENVKKFADGKTPEHELRIKLARFLFRGDNVFKKVSSLSGGEKMRAGIACLMAAKHAPKLLILDEPSNNLDIKSTEELTSALNQYNGALLIVSHDKIFLKDLNIRKRLVLSREDEHKLIIN
jgi:ATPase subunit of ABC transporter with duplicated ATPase domains